MRAIGFDLGTKTLGVAISDRSKTIASSLMTIRFHEEDYESLLPQIKELIELYEVDEIVMGFPKNMNNTIGPRGEATIAFQKRLEEHLGKDVILQDERLSTVSAHHYMLEADLSRKKRKEKVDALAASIILQTYLDKEKGKKI